MGPCGVSSVPLLQTQSGRDSAAGSQIGGGSVRCDQDLPRGHGGCEDQGEVSLTYLSQVGLFLTIQVKTSWRF
eukprot:4982-Eustigmatos_ZCMA.PRE.1